MTIRTDIVVDPTLSPRLAEVASPSVAFSVQDQVDTLRDIELNPRFGSEPKLLDSEGKANLGGGVQTGVTNTLNNVQLVFESRLTPTSTGTVTTPDTNGITLTDGAATFQADGVTRGAVVINFTDQSITEVLTVVSEIVLTCRVLRSGSDNQFDSADVYKVWNIIQCDVAGGNTVAIDNVGADLSPIFPTAFTQIVRTSSSSATISNLIALNHASFEGGVTIDQGNTTGLAGSGTTFPAGTLLQPCLTVADALLIAAINGFTQFFVLGNLTLTTGDNVAGFHLLGQGITATTFTVDAGAVVSGCHFTSGTLSGVLDGGAVLESIQLNTVTGFSGFARNCELQGPITLGNAAQSTMLDCSSIVPNVTAEIDCGGSGQALIIQNFAGSLLLSNKSGADEIEIGIDAGDVSLAADVTAGTIHLAGEGHLKSDLSVGATVKDELLNKQAIADQTWDELRSTHFVAGSYGESFFTMESGTVDIATFTPTATQFEADDITEATANHFKDRVAIFTSGALLRQAKEITAYSLVGGKGRFTVGALTEAPGDDDKFIIV